MRNVPLDRLAAALRVLFPRPGKVQWVLSVGCGAFPAAHVLRTTFPAALIVGMDCDPAALSSAGSGVSLLAAAGAQLPFHRKVTFDLVLVRHPDVDRHPVGWGQAGVTLPGRIAPGGRLLVCCYTRQELAQMQTALCGAGVSLEEIPLENRGLPAADVAHHDRWLLALTRR